LSQPECSAWQQIFDSASGTQWTNCYDSRLDPCGCVYDPDTFARGLRCSADGAHIIHVDLWHNNLRGVISEAISALTGLTLLVLHVNRLTGSIPHGISALTSLNSLGLHENFLSGSIPGGLVELNNLTDFRLYRNRLAGVVPALPFKNYTIGCMLQDATSPTNAFTCPLPPDSAACAQGPPTNCVPVPAEQAAWESLYDGTGGATHWAHCAANRLDPCGCSYVSRWTRGVTCSADGQHILKL
jgi:hypothetical protein